ncbi:MAG: hypothetical protein MZV49_06075 [Rhodopseudomonas palustris]|nr:hypothetical protein [Rhodopseudomonas palustris]
MPEPRRCARARGFPQAADLPQCAPHARSRHAHAAAPLPRPSAGSGLAAAVAAFLIWGLFPLYLKPLADGAGAARSWRTASSGAACWCSPGWPCAVNSARCAPRSPTPASRLRLMASAVADQRQLADLRLGRRRNGHVVEASLGYFINPLLNVVLGVLVLKERLNRAQWLAVALAATRRAVPRLRRRRAARRGSRWCWRRASAPTG